MTSNVQINGQRPSKYRRVSADKLGPALRNAGQSTTRAVDGRTCAKQRPKRRPSPPSKAVVLQNRGRYDRTDCARNALANPYVEFF
mgnify:CR=1 FL=1